MLMPRPSASHVLQERNIQKRIWNRIWKIRG